MRANQFHSHLLLALAVAGCTVSPERSGEPEPEPLPVATPVAHMDLKVDSAFVMGDLELSFGDIPDGGEVYVLASTEKGESMVLGHQSTLAHPVVIASITPSSGLTRLRAPHGLTAAAGEEVYVEVLSADGERRSSRVRLRAQETQSTCDGAPFEVYEPVTVLCDYQAIAGTCASPEEVPNALGMAISTFGGVPVGTTVTPVCRETEITAACCYQVEIQEPAIDTGWDTGIWDAGRPFRVDGDRRQGAASSVDVPLSPLLSEVVAAWTRMAIEEHASVAAFARFSLEMMHLGAPFELVRAATEAQLDEAHHTQLTLGVASTLAGQPITLGALKMDGALSTPDLRSVTLDVVREGCINETVSALLAMEQRDVASDPDAVAALSIIADDEARHAELAWRFVKWALDQDATLREPVMALLVGFEPTVDALPHPDAGPLRRYGVLDAHRSQRVAQRAARTIHACAAALA